LDLTLSPSEESFRDELRAWLGDNHPGEPPADEAEAFEFSRRWQRKLHEGGWAGVSWPKEYGGRGATLVELAIFYEEMVRARAPRTANVIGLAMGGPVVITHGTEEQKQRYLAPMLHADEVWCQLFSEPAAGSDLAGIQSRAVPQDDGSWKLSGQKVWTTNAQFASFGLLLARTDPDVPKHKGLTMFIVPMEAEGVTVRGLRQITGDAEFNEVFFDDVVLDSDLVVGPVNGGWGTALTTLMFERLTIGGGSEGMGYRADRFARAIAADDAAAADPEVRQRFGELATDLLALRFTGYRILTALERGQIPGPEAGMGKVTVVTAAIAAGDLIADVLGPDALDEDDEWSYLISFLPGLKSAGGTEEILRNTVGERVLGLPPEPRLDKGIPFSELRAKEREAVSA
jgi:alkylation response protein AidB-like acyl-CoA dehydrogenase